MIRGEWLAPIVFALGVLLGGVLVYALLTPDVRVTCEGTTAIYRAGQNISVEPYAEVCTKQPQE